MGLKIYSQTEMSFRWNFHHWLHRKLSIWQLLVQPVMKISSNDISISVSIKTGYGNISCLTAPSSYITQHWLFRLNFNHNPGIFHLACLEKCIWKCLPQMTCFSFRSQWVNPSAAQMEYSEKSRSILWLLMSWTTGSLHHQAIRSHAFDCAG